MSDKEKALTEQIGKLPPDLQERFLDQAKGAAMALDLLAKQDQDKDKKDDE